MIAPIERTLTGLRAQTAQWRKAGETIGVVPTMGALHQGHLSLARAARESCDRVIVTIFVNPKQFNNPEDLKNYPRTEDDDARKLESIGVDLIYVPDGALMYPDGFATNVSVGGLTDMLCGAHRPGHFDGVATVVSKLFMQTSADKAFFGEKDYQQLQIVRRMAADLDIPIATWPRNCGMAAQWTRSQAMQPRGSRQQDLTRWSIWSCAAAKTSRCSTKRNRVPGSLRRLGWLGCG